MRAGSQEEVQLRRCRPTAFLMAPLTTLTFTGRGRANRHKSSHVWRPLRIPSARIGAMSATTTIAMTKTSGCPPRPSRPRVPPKHPKLQPHRAAVGSRDGAQLRARKRLGRSTAKADRMPTCSNQLRSLALWSPSQTLGFRAVLRKWLRKPGLPRRPCPLRCGQAS